MRVAGGRNQAEAEFIQGMLLEEGVPSILRRSAGFDVPDFLAAGPRDVMVPQAGAEVAKEVLLEAEMAPTRGGGRRVRGQGCRVRLAAVVFGGGALAAFVAWGLIQLPAELRVASFLAPAARAGCTGPWPRRWGGAGRGAVSRSC